MALRLMRHRIAQVVALALFCAFVAATRVPVGWTRARIRVVTSPIATNDRTLAIALPDLSSIAGAPAAILLRLRGGDEPTTVAIALDGASIAEVPLRAGETVRVDGTAVPASGSRFTVKRQKFPSYCSSALPSFGKEV